MNKNKRIETIHASSHHHYYVMDKTNNCLLMRGNLNWYEIGLAYHMAGFDFSTEDLIECDTREEAVEHLREFKQQLKAAKFDKKH